METKHIKELEVLLKKELEISETLGLRRRRLENSIDDLKSIQNDPENMLYKFFIYAGFVLGLLILVFGGEDWGIFWFPLIVVCGIFIIFVFATDKKKEIKKNNSRLVQIRRDLLKQNQKVESIKNELQTEKDVVWLYEKLLVDKTEEEASQDFRKTLDIALATRFTRLNDTFHMLAHA